MVWIAYASVWVSMAGAVSTGIYVTGKWALLWFMLIPFFMTAGKREKNNSDDEQTGG